MSGLLYNLKSAWASIVLVLCAADYMEIAKQNKTPPEILAANKLYYEANKDKISAQKKRRRAANIEIIRSKDRAYRLRIKDEMKIRKATFYKKNKEKIVAYTKLYNARRREIKRVYNRSYRLSERGSSVRRALQLARESKKRGASSVCDIARIDIWISSWRKKKRVRRYWCNQYFNGKKCHADHIHPLSKGGAHSLENLCISCAPCNRSKGALPLFQWEKSLTQPSLF